MAAILICAAFQLGVLLWATAFGLNRNVPLRELLPLMIFAGGNAGWMLGWAAA